MFSNPKVGNRLGRNAGRGAFQTEVEIVVLLYNLDSAIIRPARFRPAPGPARIRPPDMGSGRPDCSDPEDDQHAGNAVLPEAHGGGGVGNERVERAPKRPFGEKTVLETEGEPTDRRQIPTPNRSTVERR